MWIRSQDGQLYNSRYLTALRVCSAPRARVVQNGSATITYTEAPTDGFVVVAAGRGGLVWLTRGLPFEAEARAILDAVMAALKARAVVHEIGATS